MKKVVSLLMAWVLCCGLLSACGASEPCKSCGSTPTKGYKNEYSKEVEYYCANCSSDCAFCSGTATTHYTSALGTIVFVCKDCYKQIMITSY